MPAWHLITNDGQGITLINIGVGPANAKNICDHLAVLRPDVWLMIGHCGGLRESQSIGDYVLAHAYLRDDHVLDAVLPPDIPIPSIAEVQRALYDATKQVSGMPGEEVKQRLRTGTVVTTDDRNWELRYSASALRFNLSRAVAIDMESATIAAQGYRFRVPYGTLLCVSDKPLHGEIKLPGQANRFYEGAISEHLQIGSAPSICCAPRATTCTPASCVPSTNRRSVNPPTRFVWHHAKRVYRKSSENKPAFGINNIDTMRSPGGCGNYRIHQPDSCKVKVLEYDAVDGVGRK